MKAREVAAELMKNPDAECILRVASDWVEVASVVFINGTGVHKNSVVAIHLNAIEPATGGVIVWNGAL